jgi:hypothetical protein
VLGSYSRSKNKQEAEMAEIAPDDGEDSPSGTPVNIYQATRRHILKVLFFSDTSRVPHI